MSNFFFQAQGLLDKTKKLDFLGPLALRLFLFPVFWMAGTNKIDAFSNIVMWFDKALHLPLPTVMAFLVTATEIVGAVFLLLGFGVRWVSIPLMFTMLVAAFTVHWKNGWQTIADTKMCLFNCESVVASDEKLGIANSLLEKHAKNYDWLTSQGDFVILNNGIQMAVIYFIMLLVLYFVGGGKYVSIDYWIRTKFMNNKT